MRHLLLIFMLVGGAAQPAGTQAAADYRPFTIVNTSGRTVRVDIGADRRRAAALRTATVLTPSGAIAAAFVRTERICTSLCGEEDGRTCHYEVILRAAHPVAGAVAVLAGSPQVQMITSPSPGPERPVAGVEPWLAAGAIADEGRTLRWAEFPDGVFLASSDLGRAFYAPPIDLTMCRQRQVARFVLLSCLSAELLYEGSRGIVASFADYGEASAAPVLTLRLEGRDAVIIRLGLKASVEAALLMRDDEGRWKVLVREPDYPRLC